MKEFKNLSQSDRIVAIFLIIGLVLFDVLFAMDSIIAAIITTTIMALILVWLFWEKRNN